MRFAGNAQLPKEIYAVGECYRKRRNYPSARAFYDYVVAEFPQTNDALWSGQRQIVIDIDETEDPNNPSSEVPPEIMQAIEDLITDYADIPALTRAVFYLGEEYYLRGMESRVRRVKKYADFFRNAISVWEIVMKDTAYEKTYTPFTYYMAAHCCDRTVQIDKGIRFYEKLTEDGYRRGRYAYRAPSRLGYLYKFHKKDYETAAYWYEQQNILFDKDSGPLGQNLICGDAMYALAVIYHFDLKDYDKAIEVYQTYLRDFPQGRRVTFSPMNMARCYKATGDIQTAREILQAELDKKPDMGHVDEYRRELAKLQEGAE